MLHMWSTEREQAYQLDGTAFLRYQFIVHYCSSNDVVYIHPTNKPMKFNWFFPRFFYFVLFCFVFFSNNMKVQHFSNKYFYSIIHRFCSESFLFWFILSNLLVFMYFISRNCFILLRLSFAAFKQCEFNMVLTWCLHF